MKKDLNQWVNMGMFEFDLSKIKFNKIGGKDGRISIFI